MKEIFADELILQVPEYVPFILIGVTVAVSADTEMPVSTVGAATAPPDSSLRASSVSMNNAGRDVVLVDRCMMILPLQVMASILLCDAKAQSLKFGFAVGADVHVLPEKGCDGHECDARPDGAHA